MPSRCFIYGAVYLAGLIQRIREKRRQRQDTPQEARKKTKPMGRDFLYEKKRLKLCVRAYLALVYPHVWVSKIKMGRLFNRLVYPWSVWYFLVCFQVGKKKMLHICRWSTSSVIGTRCAHRYCRISGLLAAAVVGPY